MKGQLFKSLTAMVLICSSLFICCKHDAGTPNNGTLQPIENPDIIKPPAAEIKVQTFKGQVYYIDGKNTRSITTSRAASNENGIDTTRDRIVFGNDNDTDECKIYIGQKEFSGIYSVNLESKEIVISKAQTSDGAKLEGKLSFSEDAKSVELEATETSSTGQTTQIKKTGVVKWNWSELGEWKSETVHIKKYYENLCGYAAKEKLPVQVWRGEIDFTYSAYTKGIQIPTSCFANLKAGDCIGFYYPDSGNKLNVYLEGISDQEKNWNIKNYNYNYFIYTLSQESLDYINSNEGLSLYGDGSVLDGILMGSETALKAAALEFFSKKYSTHVSGNNYHIDFSIYDDNVHNNRAISFYLVKGIPPTENNFYDTAKDSNGLSFNSPDKNIYREYFGKTTLDDTNSQISLQMYEYDFEIIDSGDYDISFRAENGTLFKIKKSISQTHNMTFSLIKDSVNDTYKLNFVNTPSDITEWINTFIELQKGYGLTLKFSPMEEWPKEDLIISFTDLSTTGSWKTEDVTSPITNEKERITVWEGDMDFTDSGFSKGFKIPKEKLASVKEDDSIYLVFPYTKKALSTGWNGKQFYELFKNVSSFAWSEDCNYHYNRLNCILKEDGVNYVKNNGLEVFADDNKLIKILIGNTDTCESYFNNLNSSND